MDLVFMLLDKGAADAAMKILTSYANKEDLWLKLAHQYKANLNEEMKYLRELFVEAMVADGYTVTIRDKLRKTEESQEEEKKM
jgi:hypothetical protein